ncbi:hypothetical protein [Rhodococcus zopfii]|uniref:hypothetical protein n=1 Tax=Rhodococcus zopfii TaxID=43772 RepID=UPI0009355203|nr:hypothetical protein [Rhodococcus zopfii]
MSKTTVAELVTVTIAGDPVRAEIAEIGKYHTDESGRYADVRLADGTLVPRANALDIELTAAARGALAAA